MARRNAGHSFFNNFKLHLTNRGNCAAFLLTAVSKKALVIRAAPHNSARRLSQNFCPNSKFRKWRNTVCISRFRNCGSGAKRRLRLADAIVRCCLRSVPTAQLQGGLPCQIIRVFNKTPSGKNVRIQFRPHPSGFVLQPLPRAAHRNRWSGRRIPIKPRRGFRESKPGLYWIFQGHPDLVS